MISSDISRLSDNEDALGARILRLRDDQIAALFDLVGIRFALKDIEGVVAEIRENELHALHLGTLLSEAESRERLLWWVALFERSRVGSGGK